MPYGNASADKLILGAGFFGYERICRLKNNSRKFLHKRDSAIKVIFVFIALQGILM
jgi:hypothetical protein